MDHRGLHWELEASHFPLPLTRWAARMYSVEQSRAIAELCQGMGLLLDGLEFREFGGRVYTAIIPIGGKPRKPPPAFLVPLLTRVVPMLRTRVARCQQTLAEERQLHITEDWLGGLEDRMLAEGRELLSRPLDDVAQMAGALDDAIDLARRGTYEHFALHAAGVGEIGRLGLRLSKRGWTPAEFTELFTGLSDTSTGPALAQQRIIDAAGVTRIAEATSLDDIRSISAEVAALLDDYLGTWALRALRYEVLEPTVAERPELVLQALQDQAARPRDQSLVARHARQRAAAAERAEATLGPNARVTVVRAQRCFPIREGNETPTVGMPLAALRRIGLAIGAHLAARGTIERDTDVFDLELDEVQAMLRDAPGAPSDPRALARDRRAERERVANTDVPLTMGPPATPPPSLAGFPADVAEMVEALLWYTDQVFGAPKQVGLASTSSVAGDGVSPGTYEGTARVVLGETEFDRIEPGDVLVCPITSPVWSMVFPAIGALVCDSGGMMSHPAIIAREFGIPGVVGTGDATTAIPDGARVRVDGAAGTITVLQGAAA